MIFLWWSFPYSSTSSWGGTGLPWMRFSSGWPISSVFHSNRHWPNGDDDDGKIRCCDGDAQVTCGQERDRQHEEPVGRVDHKDNPVKSHIIIPYNPIRTGKIIPYNPVWSRIMIPYLPNLNSGFWSDIHFDHITGWLIDPSNKMGDFIYSSWYKVSIFRYDKYMTWFIEQYAINPDFQSLVARVQASKSSLQCPDKFRFLAGSK